MKKTISTILMASILLINPQGIIAQTRNFFTGKPPTFVKATVPHDTINWRLSWYYFVLNLPVDSSESLGKVTITPGENFTNIDFNLDETQAFIGQVNKRGEPIEIQQVNQDEATQTIEVIFAEPILPNTLFTVGLKARQNPQTEGVYLFRVHAFPAGENPVGLDLGVARLTFYSVW
jgi:hypothetical protein